MCHSMKKLTWAKGFIVSIKTKTKTKTNIPDHTHPKDCCSVQASWEAVI